MLRSRPASTATEIRSGGVVLEGELHAPENAAGIMLFAHGSGSSRHSPPQYLHCRGITERGFATLLFDLLTTEEDRAYERRFDIRLPSRRPDTRISHFSRTMLTKRSGESHSAWRHSLFCFFERLDNYFLF